MINYLFKNQFSIPLIYHFTGPQLLFAENLYLRIGKTLSVKERSGQEVAQSLGLRAQGKTSCPSLSDL